MWKTKFHISALQFLCHICAAIALNILNLKQCKYLIQSNYNQSIVTHYEIINILLFVSKTKLSNKLF
jgi:hypothetical protein